MGIGAQIPHSMDKWHQNDQNAEPAPQALHGSAGLGRSARLACCSMSAMQLSLCIDRKSAVGTQPTEEDVEVICLGISGFEQT